MQPFLKIWRTAWSAGCDEQLIQYSGCVTPPIMCITRSSRWIARAELNDMGPP